MSQFVEICEEAARAGGRELLKWVGRFDVREKGPRDLVTDADLASQEIIRALTVGRFPGHQFISEEEPASRHGTLSSAAERWYVDPLDGTTNYVHRVPHYAVSIAFERQGELVAGAIFDPTSDECFTAERGSGAFLNGQRIRTSEVADAAEALVAASFSAKVDPASPEIGQFERVLLASQGVRRTGSAALNMAYVACGRFDAFWAMTTKSWDVAAGALLIAEAGGIVTLLDGSPLSLGEPHPVASSTSRLHEQMLRLLADGVPRRHAGSQCL